MSAATGLLNTLTAIFLASSATLYIGKKLDQPTIPLYIIAGILLGPNVLDILQNSSSIITTAQLGVIFLLFTAGLETELDELKDLGKTIFTAGASHTMLVGIIAFLLAIGIGFGSTASVYIALFLAFSSTMEVLNILEKRFELNTLHGKLIIGILLIEDVLAIIAISALTSLGSGFNTLLAAVISGLGIFSIAVVVSRYIAPSVLDHVEQSTEQTVFLSLTTVFIFLGLASVSNLPLAIGAFTGGLSLTKFPYGIQIRNSIKSFRDFFGTVFFVSIGALVDFQLLTGVFWPFILFTLLVILIKPFLTYLMMSYYGYGQRTSFLTGLGLGQVSEFSLFILLEGFLIGAVSDQVFALCLGIAITTITISSYAYKNHEHVYNLFSDSLIDIRRLVEGETIHNYTNIPEDIKDHIILVGGHVQGQEILQHLKEGGHDVIIVDFNVQIVRQLSKTGNLTYYGDIKNVDFDDLNVEDAQLIVSTVPAAQGNIRCIEAATEHDIPAIVRAETLDEALDMYELGADYVIFPDFLAAEKIGDYVIDHLNGERGLEEARNEEIQYLEDREEELILLEYGPTFLKHFEEDIEQEDEG